MGERAQAIIIRNNKMLFGYGKILGELRHFFIGGRIEVGESSSETVLRELREEANVDGNIIFKFTNELQANHHTFLVDIGEAEVSLGYDPEEMYLPQEELSLKGLKWIDLENNYMFTDIDKEYFSLLMTECDRIGYDPS